MLDRNGLRPSRYYITKDGRMILSSEVGVLPCDPENILVKDRLRPGKMLLVDTIKGEVVDDEKLKEFYASQYQSPQLHRRGADPPAESVRLQV